MPPISHQRPGCPAAPGARPLPDPAAVRLCVIPDSAPPYDLETAPGASAEGLAGSSPGSGMRGTGAPPPAVPGKAVPGKAAAKAAVPGHASAPGRCQPPTPGWPGQFAQVLAEALAGSRPARQLVPWTTERARDHIQRLGAQLTSSQQPRVRHVVTSCPAADVMEMTVVVGFGARVRALAVRLERSGAAAGQRASAEQARWLCTAVEAA